MRLLKIIRMLPTNKNLFHLSFKNPFWLIKPIMEEKSNKNPAIKNALGKRKIPISKQIEPNFVTLLLFFFIGNPNYYSN